VIVVGGNVAEVGEILVVGIREVVFHHSPPSATLRLSIGLSISGERAALHGASHMVTQHILTPAAVEAVLHQNWRPPVHD
jgi:glucokinase